MTKDTNRDGTISANTKFSGLSVHETRDETSGNPFKTTPNNELSSRVQLKRSLGLWNGVAINIGMIVGSGIFVSPKGVLAESGSIGAALIVWTMCGLLALLGALCFSELGTSVSSSGGEYTYIKMAYGPMASFAYLWILVAVVIPCSNVISALTFANYVLQPLYDSGCSPPENAIRLVALAILLILIYVNCVSVKVSIKLQNSFTLAKVVALLLIIVYGVFYLVTGKAVNFQSQESVWANTQTNIPQLVQAFYAGFYTYAGWNALNCVTEEIKDPVKNMPRAIIISITSVTLIYILTNIAYFTVLSREEVLSADAIAVIFGQKAMNQYTQWMMPMAVALSTMSGLNATIFAMSRIIYAAAKQNQLMDSLRTVNKDHSTPIPSLLFLSVTSIIYLATTQILALIRYTVFVEALFSALAVSTVLTLRYKMPNLQRPIKIPTIVPILYLLFSLILLVLPVWSSPVEATIGILIVLAGLPVYYVTVRWSVKPKSYQRIVDHFNLLVQKLTLSVRADTDISSSL